MKMANEKRRPGKRGDRNARVGIRIPKLGYYLIVTDTVGTEQNYFNGLRDSIRPDIRKNLVIRVEKSKTTEQLIHRTKELSMGMAQYCRPWIVFDRVEVPRFDEMIRKAENEGIQVGWSNPCFEIWFHAYLGSMPPFMNSQECWKAFSAKLEKQLKYKYGKNDRQIFQKLEVMGNVHTAIKIARKKYEREIEELMKSPSEAQSVTAVYKLVEEILSKAETT